MGNDTPIDRTFAIEIRTPAGTMQKVSFSDIKSFICPKAEDAEIVLFLKTAQAEQLNPFTKEIQLIKYSERDPASIVISMDARLKVAEHRPEFSHAKAGIIIQPKTGAIQFIEGTFYDNKNAALVGGWARVWLKTRKEPIYSAVPLQEMQQFTRDGQLTRFWRTMPATMSKKVALYRALHEAMPSLFHGPASVENLVENAEVEEGEFHEVGNEPPTTVPPPATTPPPGGMPESFIDAEGKPRWDYFWAKLREQFGIEHDIALKLVKIDSFSETYGIRLGDAWDAIVKALNHGREQQPGEAATGTQPAAAADGTLKVTSEPLVTSKIDITWDDLKFASPTQETKQPPAPDEPWEYKRVASAIVALRAKKVKQVLGQDFADRMNKDFKVELPAGTQPNLKTVYELLSREKKKEFCFWIADLQAMSQ